jgi:bacteriocin-like protein
MNTKETRGTRENTKATSGTRELTASELEQVSGGLKACVQGVHYPAVTITVR